LLKQIGRSARSGAVCGNLVVHANSAIDAALHGDVLVGRRHGQLDPPADPDRGHAVDPEMAEAALDRAALGVEDPGLRADVDGEPEVGRRGHAPIRSSAR